MKRRIASLVAGTVVMLVVGACGAESAPPWVVRYYPGVPPGDTTGMAYGTPRDDAVWATAGRMAVVTMGSSSCPRFPERLEVPASDVLTITVNAQVSGPCTADLAPTTSIIEVPTTLDVTRGVTVAIIDGSYSATVALPPRTGAGN